MIGDVTSADDLPHDPQVVDDPPDGTQVVSHDTPASGLNTRPLPAAQSGNTAPAGNTLLSRYTLRGGGWSVWLLSVVTFALYLALSLTRWNRWDNPSWDLGIFEQAIKGYAHLGAPIVDLKGPGFNQLGDHFSPLLALIAPFYRMFPTPVTLLVAQCVLVAISVVPLTFVARRLLGNWTGLGIGLAYALSWGIQSAVDVQFHEYALAAPILAFGLAAALEKRWLATCVWIGLLLGVKEDLGLTVAGFGVVLWLWGQRRRGAWLAGIGAGGMALVLGVIIPFFNPHGQYDYWGKLGDDGAGPGGDLGPASGGGGILEALWDAVVGLVTPGIKYETLLLLVVITAFTAFRSPLLLMAVPTLVWRFAGSTEYYWGSTWHYSIILMPIMFAAAIDGLQRLKASPHAWARRYARAAPAVMVCIALVLCVRFPLWDLTKAQTYERPDRLASAERALAAVPAGASVASDLGLVVQLVSEHRVFWIGTDETAPQYVSIDQNRGWGGNPPDDVAAYAERRFPGAPYEVVFDENGYVIAQRMEPGVAPDLATGAAD